MALPIGEIGLDDVARTPLGVGPSRLLLLKRALLELASPLARVALRDALRGSLRVVRGSLGEAAEQLQSESDLLLLAGTPPLPTRRAAVSQPTRHQLRVAVLGDGDEPASALGRWARSWRGR